MPFADYFDRRSGQFAGLYRSRAVSRLIGRAALFERLDFAVAKIEELGATRVLDIGCGSGPLFEPLAARGVRVTGLEPAPGMLRLAQEAAARCNGLVDVVPGGWEDLARWDPGDRYDVAVALGIFDYLPNPGDLLAAMAAVAGHSIVSFPRPGLRTNLRKLRYGARGVSVYGYALQRIETLAGRAGTETTQLEPLGRAGYILLGRNRARTGRPGGDPVQDPVVRP
ncbi:MAG: class I SAM-dependent methyltransferase [Acidimicrobiales bacterium]